MGKQNTKAYKAKDYIRYGGSKTQLGEALMELDQLEVLIEELEKRISELEDMLFGYPNTRWKLAHSTDKDVN